MTQPEIEPWSSRPLANTLLISPMAWYSATVECNIFDSYMNLKGYTDWPNLNGIFKK